MSDAYSELGPTMRRARADDADAIAELINRARAGETFFNSRIGTSETEIRKLQEQGHFLVIDRKDGGLAASIFVRMTRRRGYFGMLSVAPEFRGSDLDRRLVAVAEALCEAEGCTAMDLQVIDLRTELPPWYRSLGYRVCGTVEIDEGGGEPGWFHSYRASETILPQCSQPGHYIRMTKALA